jgi:hypothetical protein
VTIVSPDKDLAQMVNDDIKIRQISPSSGSKPATVYDAAGVFAKFGIHPEQVVDFLALCGDKSDNVPGAPGVGAVKAAALLKQWGALDNAWAAADQITPPAVQRSIVDNAERIRLSRDLIRLRTDAPIDAKIVFTEKEIKPLTSPADYEAEERAAIQEADAPGSSGTAIISAPPEHQRPAQDAQIIKAQSVAAVRWNDGLEPTTLTQTFAFAAWVVNSRMFKQFENKEAVGTAIVLGRELGLGAITALSNIHMVEGRPTMGAHLIIARVMQSPDCEYFQFIDGDGTFAEYETKRRNNPKPNKLRYTIEQAKAAGLVKEPKEGKQPGPWLTRPDEMLRKTCGVKLARVVYPEAASGIYSTEEFANEPE